MRRYVAAALAVPVLAQIYLPYLPVLLRRSVFARTSLALVMGGVLGLGVVVFSRPAGTQATPPHQSVPLTSAEFRTALRTDVAPDAPVTVTFSTPMDRRSVEAALRVAPATEVRLAWNAANTSLTVRPTTSWATGIHHTVTIEAGALAATGRPLSGPVRAAFLTREATAARILPLERHGRRALPTTAFLLEFGHAVDLASLRAGLTIRPGIEGTIEPMGSARSGDRFVFRPAAPLKPNTVYRLRLGPDVRDAAGAPIHVSRATVVRTAALPEVVRFRPRHQTKAVERGVLLSVRFTQPMDARSTKAGFRVAIDGKKIRGTIRFAEGRTVLVFRPSQLLPFGKKVTMTVAASARSEAGLPLAKRVTARIAIMRRPAPTPSSGGSGAVPPPSGGGAGGGSWRAVEEYYLGLMNCTRTGGWVTSSGRCDSPGGRDVAPLWIHSGISSEVARPYARMLATSGACDHFVGGTPGDRLRRAGYTSYIWAENLGCRSGNPYAAVLGSHRFFQDEWDDGDPTDHYTNLMNPDYDRVGIGVWVAHGNVRLVVDFYHPR